MLRLKRTRCRIADEHRLHCEVTQEIEEILFMGRNGGRSSSPENVAFRKVAKSQVSNRRIL